MVGINTLLNERNVADGIIMNVNTGKILHATALERLESDGRPAADFSLREYFLLYQCATRIDERIVSRNGSMHLLNALPICPPGP